MPPRCSGSWPWSRLPFPTIEGMRPRSTRSSSAEGTPSLLPPDLIEAILRAVHRAFRLANSCEITLEANPGTLGRQDLERLRRAGVNRLSLGAQSAQPAELRLLDRAHTFDDVAAAVGQARLAGFDNLNLDLIYGLPWQAMDGLERHAPSHARPGARIISRSTPCRWNMGRRCGPGSSAGLVASPDADRAAEMYEWAGERLAADGYLQYEISNWAKDGPAGAGPTCRPSPAATICSTGAISLTWGSAPGRMVALLAGATPTCSRLGSTLNEFEGGPANPAPCSPAAADRTAIDLATQMDETMLLGFRLTREGVRPSEFMARFGEDVEPRYGRRLGRLRVRRSDRTWAGPTAIVGARKTARQPGLSGFRLTGGTD